MCTFFRYYIPKIANKVKDISDKDSNGTSGTPDSELDSGISINGHYDRIDEIKTMTGKPNFGGHFCTFLLRSASESTYK